MWRSGWVLIPDDVVPVITDETGEADVELWDYPAVGFPDGEVEGTDLNNLWLLVCDSPEELPMWGSLIWNGPAGSEKIAPVRLDVVDLFSKLPESRVGELAAAWRETESETSSLQSWHSEDVADAIRALKFLARQHRQLRPAWQLLMVWWI